MSFSARSIEDYQNRAARRTNVGKSSLQDNIAQAIKESSNASDTSSPSSSSSESSKSNGSNEDEESKDFDRLGRQFQREKKKNQNTFVVRKSITKDPMQLDGQNKAINRRAMRGSVVNPSSLSNLISSSNNNKTLAEQVLTPKNYAAAAKTTDKGEPQTEDMEVEDIVIEEVNQEDIDSSHGSNLSLEGKMDEMFSRPPAALTQSLYKQRRGVVDPYSKGKRMSAMHDPQSADLLFNDDLVEDYQRRKTGGHNLKMRQAQEIGEVNSSGGSSEYSGNLAQSVITREPRNATFVKQSQKVFNYEVGENVKIENTPGAIVQTSSNNNEGDKHEAEVSIESFDQNDFLMMTNMQDNDRYYRMTISQKDIDNSEKDEKDILTIVDQNERRHQDIAKEQLKHDSLFTIKLAQQEVVQNKIMSDFQKMSNITNRIKVENSSMKAQATCIGLSDDLLFVGNSAGQLWMFDRANEEMYSMFIDKNKEFSGNAMTAIDVHPTRPDYVVMGFSKGQLVLLDSTDPKKALKTIKDHHKGAMVSNVQFCDWRGKDSENEQAQGQSSQRNQDKQIWMFVSIDTDGKVVLTTVEKILFVFNSSKHIIIDPKKNSLKRMPIFQSIACKFYSPIYRQGDDNDNVTLIALGSQDIVQIMSVRPNKHFEIMTIQRQKRYYSAKKQGAVEVTPRFPSMCWGYGHSPALKDKCYSILSIGWGPLIQLCVINDIYSESDDQIFKDGFYLLRPEQVHANTSANTRAQKLQLQQQKQGSPNKEESKHKNDIMEVSSEDSNASKEDEGQSFEDSNLNIENIQFIADGILLVLLSNLEIRILYTQHFSPREYCSPTINTPRKESEISDQSVVIAQSQPSRKDVKQKAELGQSVSLNYLIKSSHGLLYHQTVKFYKGMLVALTALTATGIVFSQHLTWLKFINNYKNEVKGDLTKIFARALAIYQGQIKGYSGVPEDKELREDILKAGLKLLISETMSEVIDKWNQQYLDYEQGRRGTLATNSTFDSDLNGSHGHQQQRQSMATYQQFDNSYNQVKQQEVEKQKIDRYRLLIRLSIEFCVELHDCYFLFNDLFQMFQDEKMDVLFVEEMEPFIIAGRFAEWELPNDILQNHIINYYKDIERPENFEKIIMNLNFNQCPKSVVLELVHFAEQHFLSTAILFLYTQVYERRDDSSCVQVLFSLYKLYKEAGKKREGSIEELKLMDGLPNNSEQRLAIEKSQFYLGYKMLWVVKLFLSGKKFPSGNIRDKKWRTYVHDIMEFVSTKDILASLLNIDAESFFQIMSVLFYDGKVKDFVTMGRAAPSDVASGGATINSLSHKDFLRKIDAYCQQGEEVSEDIRQCYLFFVANVVAKSQIEKNDPEFYFRIVKELLRLHKRFLLFNKHLLMRTMSKNKLLRRMSRAIGGGKKVSDEVKHVFKCEQDLLSIMHMCEPMEDPMINQLLKLAENTQFNEVKVYLYEKKHDYVKCLQLYLSGIKVGIEVMSSQQLQEKAFKWIREKLNLLEEKAGESAQNKHIYETFKREVTQNIKQMVQFNAIQTFKLIDEKFGGNHKEIIESLSARGSADEQLKYLEALLQVKEQHIQDTIKNYSLQSSDAVQAKRYLEYLKLHLRLCCQLQPVKVLSIVENIVKHSFYPMEDCLHICMEFKQMEACALLNKKLGKYFDSVQQYIGVMKDPLVVPLDMLKKELNFAYWHRISFSYQVLNDKDLPICTKFDQLFKCVKQICKKNYQEVDQGQEELIWYSVLDAIFALSKRPEVSGQEEGGQVDGGSAAEKVAAVAIDGTTSESSPCWDFFNSRITIFVYQLLEHIPFKNFIDHALKLTGTLGYGDLKDIIMSIFGDSQSEQNVTQNAKNTIIKVNADLFESYQNMSGYGLLFRSRQCFICKHFFDHFLTGDHPPVEISTHDLIESDERIEAMEEIKIFQCRHTFHIRCLIKDLRAKNPDSKDGEKELNKKLDKQQCPYCFSKSFDIEGANGSPMRPRKRISNAPGPKNLSSSDNASGNLISGANDQSPMSSPEHVMAAKKKREAAKERSQTVLKKEWMKFNTIMGKFDENNETDAMTSKNFRL